MGDESSRNLTDRGRETPQKPVSPQYCLSGRRSGERLIAIAQESARIQRLKDAEQMIETQIDPTKLSADLLRPIRFLYEKSTDAGFNNEKVREACEKLIVFNGLLSDTTRAHLSELHGAITKEDAKDAVVTLLKECKKSKFTEVEAQGYAIVKALKGDLTQDTKDIEVKFAQKHKKQKAEVAAEPSKRNDHEKGSWDAVLDKNLWTSTQRFWDNGEQFWSQDSATIKTLDNVNRHEFQKMQDLKIPGYYLQHEDKDGKIDAHAYIPVGAQGAWKKAFGSSLADTQIHTLRNNLRPNSTRHGWSLVKRLDRPDVRIQSPGGTPHDVEQLEGTLKTYHDNNFKNRRENEISLGSFRGLFSSLKSVGNFERITELPEEGDKKRVQTPIIWKVDIDQGSSSRTRENEGN